MSLAQSPLWVLGNQIWNSQQIPQSLPTPSGTHVYTGQKANRSANSAYNPVTGELLFFVVDGNVYDKDGFLINQLVGSGGSVLARGIADLGIVADPGNCRRYYIFIGEKDLTYTPFSDAPAYYAILDLDLPRQTYNTTRKGEFVGAANFNIINPINNLIPANLQFQSGPKKGGVHFAISKLNTSVNNHVVLAQLQNDYVYSFTLNSNGLSFNSVFDPVTGLTPITWPYDVAFRRSELEIIPITNGYRVAGGCLTGNANKEFLFTCDLTSNGNIIPGTIKAFDFPLTNTAIPIRGIEFSPNGDFIYFTHNTHTQYPTRCSFSPTLLLTSFR